MKPVQLLTVTESLVETKETPGRYRLPKRSLLPKFGPRRNPFAAPGTEAAPPTVPAEPPARPAPIVEPKAATCSTPAKQERSPARGATIANRTRGLLKLVDLKVIDPTRRALSTLPGRARGWFRRPPRRTAQSREGGLPVQGELSLEKVRVVRNDLRDSDLEVVPLRSSAGKVAPDTAANGDAPAAADVGVWNRLTGRIRQAARAEAR